MVSGAIVLLDCMSRVRDSLHKTLPDLTQDELHREPHPSIGWLAWRIARVTDSIPTSVRPTEQLWIKDGWAQRFSMQPEPYDFGRSTTHTRQQVKELQATPELLLAYFDAVYDNRTAYIATLTEEELGRELDEPQYDPIPTVSVRLVSLVENMLHNSGMIAYLKAYHRLGGWFPAEAADRSVFR